MSNTAVGSKVKFSMSHLDEQSWKSGNGRGLGWLVRDLGIGGATDGMVTMQVLRSTGQSHPESGWQQYELALDVIHVMNGWVEIAFFKGAATRLSAGTCACIPAGTPFNELCCSSDAVVLRITVNAEYLDHWEKPQKPVTFSLCEETADSWKQGAGRRSFLAYRDFGVGNATGNRLRIKGYRNSGAVGAETGWHYHTCGLQVNYKLRGASEITFAPGTRTLLSAGSCMCIPPGTPHDERSSSAGGEGIEITLGEIGTVSCDAP